MEVIAHQQVLNYNMEDLILKRGSDRKVIIDAFRGIVIKIAINERGLQQNENEKNFNEKRPDITAKVIFYDVEYLIMEYVDIIEYFNFKLNPLESVPIDIKGQFLYVLDELNKELGDVLDNTQIGVTRDGRVVAYDYGITEHLLSNCNLPLLNNL